MKYYYVKDNNNIGICSITENKIPDIGIEITKNKYDEMHQGILNNQIIYLDNDELKLRDRFTKWDEKTKSWIKDDEAIDKNKKEQLIAEAQQALNDTANYDMPSYRSRLTKEQNAKNDKYRAQLWDIIERKIETNELPLNPRWEN